MPDDPKQPQLPPGLARQLGAPTPPRVEARDLLPGETDPDAQVAVDLCANLIDYCERHGLAVIVAVGRPRSAPEARGQVDCHASTGTPDVETPEILLNMLAAIGLVGVASGHISPEHFEIGQ